MPVRRFDSAERCPRCGRVIKPQNSKLSIFLLELVATLIGLFIVLAILLRVLNLNFEYIDILLASFSVTNNYETQESHDSAL